VLRGARIAPVAVLFTFVIATALTGCGPFDDDETTTQQTAAGCTPAQRPQAREGRTKKPKPGQAVQKGEAVSAIVRTSCGQFEIELDTEDSPKTANSFAYLVERGFYDGLWFHRIEPGFVIQGGDPLGSGLGGPDYNVTEKPPFDQEYRKGTVAMAKTEADPRGSSGSQFFIVTAADAGLNADFAVLGKVSGGLDVVERIGQLGGEGGTPTQVVLIESIKLQRD
jgi:cyclophilin family peptidyl-prolyl cis-trans isomerase